MRLPPAGPDGRRESLPGGRSFPRGEAVVHGSINNTAGDGVDLDITGSQLLGQCFGEAVHTTLEAE